MLTPLAMASMHDNYGTWYHLLISVMQKADKADGVVAHADGRLSDEKPSIYPTTHVLVAT